MTLTTTADTTGQGPHSGSRRWIARTPLWVRVTVLTATILIGVLVATIVMGGTGIGARSDPGGHTGGGHGSGGQTQMTDHNSGDHGSNRDRGGSDHNGDPDHGSSGSR
jgi:hypothetical protein